MKKTFQKTFDRENVATEVWNSKANELLRKGIRPTRSEIEYNKNGTFTVTIQWAE